MCETVLMIVAAPPGTRIGAGHITRETPLIRGCLQQLHSAAYASLPDHAL